MYTHREYLSLNFYRHSPLSLSRINKCAHLQIKVGTSKKIVRNKKRSIVSALKSDDNDVIK